MSVEMELTLIEFNLAVSTSMLRIVASASIGCNHATTYKRSLLKRLHEETVGACGEIAFAKYLGRFFVPSVNTFHSVPDVANAEVRTTDNENGCLIVRDNDADERAFVLAVVIENTVKLVGWTYGRDAKLAEFVRDPHGNRPAWFVPQDRLKAIRPRQVIEAVA